MDAWSSKHIALTIHGGDKMLIGIMNFHMSSDESFGSDMSSDGLKVLALCLLMGMEPVTMTDCQMDCDGCKKQP